MTEEIPLAFNASERSQPRPPITGLLAKDNISLPVASSVEQPGSRRSLSCPQEKVPAQYYCNGIPPELQGRLQKLTKEDEIIAETNAFAPEEINLRNLGAKQAVNIHQRRGALDQQPVTQMPLQIEIVPTTGGNEPGMQLTPQLERQIKPTTNATG